jgi:hypothetical protein
MKELILQALKDDVDIYGLYPHFVLTDNDIKNAWNAMKLRVFINRSNKRKRKQEDYNKLANILQKRSSSAKIIKNNN